MVHAGLVAAALMEKALNRQERENLVRARANELRDAIRANLWCSTGYGDGGAKSGGSDETGYYYRSLWSDTNDPDTRIDGSSLSILFTGLEHVRKEEVAENRDGEACSDSSSTETSAASKDSNSRFKSHLSTVVANLTRREFGIARYDGDLFFYSSVFDPGGREVGAPSPPWGVTTMFTAWCESLLDASAADSNARSSSENEKQRMGSEQMQQENSEASRDRKEESVLPSDRVSKRLSWMLKHAAPYGMPVGEAVDGVGGGFVMSSCPDIYEYAAVYVWTVLVSQNLAPVPDPNLF
jgi:GH15 family glucan-1,4-alpha-glucosidase